MASGQLGGLMRQIRRLIGSGPPGDATDSQLLERFRRDQDQGAFTALVQRHGPLVLGVCRRVLHDPHEAEDAFQATFFVLARRANSIRNPEALSSWLHGVAARVAARARSGMSKRKTHETQVPVMAGADSNPDQQPESSGTDALTAASQREIRSVLDEELGRLPDKYRLPMVLCYFEGKTNEEAAQQLGWSKGAVSGQLARARDVLRDRLARRGLAVPSAGLVAVLGEQTASAAISPALVESTVTASMQFLIGQAVVGASPKVGLLAEGVIASMDWTKAQIAASVLLVLSLSGAGVIGYQSWASKTSMPNAVPKVATRGDEDAPALPPNVDPVRWANSRVVMRVKRQAEQGVRDGYRWQDVAILEVLKNATEQKFGHRLLIASLAGKHGVPAEECTIYLEPLTENDLHWKLLGGGAPDGISHVAPVPEKHSKIH